MEENIIISAKNIAKIGDTKIDMKEGKNAGCGLTIGVLTGYENKENLFTLFSDGILFYKNFAGCRTLNSETIIQF